MTLTNSHYYHVIFYLEYDYEFILIEWFGSSEKKETREKYKDTSEELHCNILQALANFFIFTILTYSYFDYWKIDIYWEAIGYYYFNWKICKANYKSTNKNEDR